jgi:amino acid transporter
VPLLVHQPAAQAADRCGQPRIFFSMARDGLLPKWAARVDVKTRVPRATTLVTGVVGLPYQAWERFALWLGIGLVLYFLYGARHSRLRRSA